MTPSNKQFFAKELNRGEYSYGEVMSAIFEVKVIQYESFNISDVLDKYVGLPATLSSTQVRNVLRGEFKNNSLVTSAMLIINKTRANKFEPTVF